MLLSLNKLSLVILTVSALISLAYSSSTSPSATAASATSGNTNTASQTSSPTSLPSSSTTNTTTNTPTTSTAGAAITTPTSSNQPSPTSSSVVPNASNPTQGSNPTTASPSSTTSTTPTTTPAPVCINQNCTGSFANLSCLNENGTTCNLGSGFCFQTVTTIGTSSMVYTGCVDTCDAMVSTTTNYTEDKRCCRENLCNLQAISLPPGSSSTRATSCFWLMLIFVVCVFLS